MHKLRCDRTIDATANGSNDATLGSTYFTNACDLLSDELFLSQNVSVSTYRNEHYDAHHCPVLSAPTNTDHKVPNHFLPAFRVRDLRVELNAIERLGVMRDGSIWCSCGASDDVERLRHLRELVPMRHPNLRRAHGLGSDRAEGPHQHERTCSWSPIPLNRASAPLSSPPILEI